MQSERVAQGIYMKYAKELIDKGEAYYCFCDKERLDSLKTTVAGKEISIYDKHCLHLSKEEIEANLAAGKPYVIRQNNPTEGTTTFEDEIYGDITVDNAELDDMILIKSDGYPTYNFANVVDDHLMGITHVVRGNEYLSSSLSITDFMRHLDGMYLYMYTVRLSQMRSIISFQRDVVTHPLKIYWIRDSLQRLL